MRTMSKEPTPATQELIKQAGCRRCKFFHGASYSHGFFEKNYLNCAVHPIAPPGEFCPDWEEASLGKTQRKIARFRRETRVYPLAPCIFLYFSLILFKVLLLILWILFLQ